MVMIRFASNASGEPEAACWGLAAPKPLLEGARIAPSLSPPSVVCFGYALSVSF